ncbi:hypothetical protein LCL61_14135 [Amycolatopsis coloradensis]|uniref:Uncharacterized protein n=1 Tax=Amycolatopsis coloradensis TaxID=76021 RepID=A0ACD5BBG6_9PSEU
MIVVALVISAVALVVALVAVRVAFVAHRRATESRTQARRATARADSLSERIRDEAFRAEPDPSVIAKLLRAVGVAELRR